jgi:hypothetical protein
MTTDQEPAFWPDLPDLTPRTLQDWGGGYAMREARRLVDDEAVRDLQWAAPLLSGKVFCPDGSSLEVRLNLRNLVFVENRCGCLKGRQGYICAHALALCLATMRQQKAALETRSQSAPPAQEKAAGTESRRSGRASPEEVQKKRSGAPTLSSERVTLRTITVHPDAPLLHPWFLLPPNFA